MADKKILDVEDEMIFLFCQDYGGLEEGMPIVREQFKRTGVDFREPTKEGLMLVAENLVKVTESFRGAELAKKQKSKFKVLLNSLD
jgi:hypothetical protein